MWNSGCSCAPVPSSSAIGLCELGEREAPEFMVMPALGLWISRSLVYADPNGPGRSHFARFFKEYWPALDGRKLHMPEWGEAMMRTIEAQILEQQGERPRWELIPHVNPGFSAALPTLASQGEIGEAFAFFGENNLATQLEAFSHERLALVQNRRPIHINYNGAREWAERQARWPSSYRSMPVIGPEDAVIIAGEQPGLPVEGLVRQFLWHPISLFKTKFLPSSVHPAWESNSALARTVKNSENVPELIEFLRANYGQSKLSNTGAVCRVIACSKWRWDPQVEFASLIEESANPGVNAHLIIDRVTAQQFLEQPFALQ